MPEPLSAAEFKALRLWAMNYATLIRIRLGVGIWPVFRYSKEQEQRLIVIAGAVGGVPWLIWLALFVAIATVCTIVGMLGSLVPLMRRTLQPDGVVAEYAMKTALTLDFIFLFVLSTVVATWIAGRLLAPWLLVRQMLPEAGDAALLSRVRRQIAVLVVASAVAAALPSLVVWLTGA